MFQCRTVHWEGRGKLIGGRDEGHRVMEPSSGTRVGGDHLVGVAVGVAMGGVVGGSGEP